VAFAIGDPGRAALELPDGPPPGRIGPADAEVSAASMPGLLVRAAACRGLMHRANGTPRQDAFALGRVDGTSQLVAIVCDGVGQFGRSDEAAVFMSRRLSALGMDGVPWPDAFARANKELDKIARETRAASPGDSDADGMATTAVAVSVHPEQDGWAGEAAWVGDSTVWHLDAGSQWTLITGPPDGESSNDEYHSTGVRPLPSPDGGCISREFRVGPGALFVMTDGVANPLRWSSDVQEALSGWWRRPPDPFTFAAQVGFARKSHMDDRTVIGIWPSPGEADEDKESEAQAADLPG
jgi:Protein phosphatase 2C